MKGHERMKTAWAGITRAVSEMYACAAAYAYAWAKSEEGYNTIEDTNEFSIQFTAYLKNTWAETITESENLVEKSDRLSREIRRFHQRLGDNAYGNEAFESVYSEQIDTTRRLMDLENKVRFGGDNQSMLMIADFWNSVKKESSE